MYLKSMQTIILEGTSTAGKTTIANQLALIFKKKHLKTYIVDEAKTLLPLLKNPSPWLAKNILDNLIEKLVKQKNDIVIFDRCHLSAAAVTRMPIKDFKTIELFLATMNPSIVFLEIDETKILNRILNSVQHRGPSWGKNILTKGKDKSEIRDHYIQTQKKLDSFYKKSSFTKYKINTTEEKFEEYSIKIAKKF